ncbi:methyl-accepting chemotaxis protein [Pseudomonas sp. MAFF212427]|uniref:Methyl-accepting chemotaxis protein n=2 Tax=Pseudomonas brassicae TaxID=2708063 RepID=A0A6B3NPT7_9PSED|nr:methyl-accepting chemotaxis protein [Pseudomonas brassicae]NER65185.1 methyl-accepting chemotaxis protein [Pseudomonas brassicae]
MRTHLKFSHKILLSVSMIVIVAFASLTAYNDARQHQAIRQNLQRYLQEMGGSTANTIVNWLQGRVLLIENLAQAVAITPTTANTAQLLKQPALAGTFSATYVGGQDASFTTFPDVPMPADYDPRARPWYKGALASQGPAITEPYIDTTTGGLVVSVAAAVRQGDQRVAVAGGDLPLQAVADSINALDFNGMGYAFLVSADGRILVHPDKALVMQSLEQVYPGQALQPGAGLREVQSAQGPRIVSFAPVRGLPSLDWYIGLSVDPHKAFAALSDYRRSALLATSLAVVISVLLLGALMRLLMRPMLQMTRAMQDIADGEGDLTRRLSIRARDEFGVLGTAFNRFVERVHASLREVASATDQVNQVARRVVEASNASMLNCEQQSTRTHSVATAINQLGAAAQEIAGNAAQASHKASDAREQAEAGRQVVEQTIAAINRLSLMLATSSSSIETLNGKTVNIGQILEVITSISQQTNLLALNAAIEAARAGEAGRGFAVVADEVRNLAHRTQESAQQVQGMIEELQVGARGSVSTMTQSQRHSEDSVAIANLAGERLGSVTLRIGEIDGMNQSVATATEEQTAVVGSINSDIREINSLNREGVDNLTSTLQACADLQQQAARLTQLVGSFRL